MGASPSARISCAPPISDDLRTENSHDILNLSPEFFVNNDRQRPPLHLVRKVRVTSQEGKVLIHVIRGWTNREIGDALGLCPETVRTYLRSLYRKTGLRRREALVWWWIKQQIASQSLCEDK